MLKSLKIYFSFMNDDVVKIRIVSLFLGKKKKNIHNKIKMLSQNYYNSRFYVL